MKNLWILPFEPVNGSLHPIFRQDLPKYSLFYTAGYLVLTQPSHADEIAKQLKQPVSSSTAAVNLLRKAQAAQEQWEKTFLHTQFKPLCLTLYTSQQCNLACSYCFSQDEQTPPENDLDIPVICQAAELVASNCKRAGVPFTLVIHGGGEPTLDRRLPEILSVVEKIAAKHVKSIFRYLATNGVMPAEQARWAAEHFDQIGLSCDGPADIQSTQRPLKNRTSSTPYVERTAEIIREAGKPLHIRATVTAETFRRMPEIAAYLCAELHAAEIRIEPVFQGGRSSPDIGVQPCQAEDFCEAFLAARQVARSYDARWQASGSRLWEIHGRYCQIFRNVLHLLPGNSASACFKTGASSEVRASGLQIEKTAGTGFAIDPAHVGALQDQLAQEDPLCLTCFNRFHCDRACPDRCPADLSSNGNPVSVTAELRCAINRMLSTAQLQERAETLAPLLQQHPVISTKIEGASS